MTMEAYEPPPDNDGVREWARVVQGTLMGLGMAGWVAAWLGTPDWALTLAMIWVTVVIEVWGFHAYRQWSLALMRENVGAQCLYWFIVLAGCAAWTVFSIYHAIPLMSGHAQGAMGVAPAYIAFTCLALTLPLKEWAIDRIERAPLKTAQKAASAPKPRRPDLRVVGKGAAAVGIALAPAADALAAPNATQPPPRERAPIVQMADAQAVRRDKVARAQQMHSEGVNKNEISRRLGVHRNTVGNWLKAA